MKKDFNFNDTGSFLLKRKALSGKFSKFFFTFFIFREQNDAQVSESRTILNYCTVYFGIIERVLFHKQQQQQTWFGGNVKKWNILNNAKQNYNLNYKSDPIINVQVLVSFYKEYMKLKLNEISIPSISPPPPPNPFQNLWLSNKITHFRKTERYFTKHGQRDRK